MVPPALHGRRWGTNIHFYDPQPGEMPQLAQAFSVARYDFVWAVTEKKRGVYDFSHYETLLKSLKKYNVQPYWILVGKPVTGRQESGEGLGCRLGTSGYSIQTIVDQREKRERERQHPWLFKLNVPSAMELACVRVPAHLLCWAVGLWQPNLDKAWAGAHQPDTVQRFCPMGHHSHASLQGQQRHLGALQRVSVCLR